MAATREIFNDLDLLIQLNEHIEEIAATQTDREAARAALPRKSSFQVLAELASVTASDARIEAQFEHQRASFLTDVGDSPPLPFHLQGDQEFNQASALSKRRALRQSTEIQTRISFLWEVARGRKRSITRRSSGVTGLQPAAKPNLIDESDYMSLMLLVFKVLRDDFVLELAKIQIHCDWEVDSHHGKMLKFDEFFSALFELVDVWTCDILESTYTRFLELLTRRITVRVIVFLDDMVLKLALCNNFDEAVVVKAIPLSTITQFASIAPIVKPKGVMTVGELAQADPRMIEDQRLGYLKKNDISQGKIGADLQNLLKLFNGISEQFEDANYTLENNVLVRQPAKNKTTEGDTPNGVPTRQCPPLKRMNTLHDLSLTEPGAINALRTTFLIEKDISIHRQVEQKEIRKELAKFGVDLTDLEDTEACDKYAKLYEMFVLHDGESLQALAKSILAQIKLELAVNGIQVRDREAEAMYDEFYEIVVGGTGETIVESAKNWMDEAIKTNNVSSFVKEDFHQLKSIDEVKLLGTQAGDDEFVSLLSTEEDDEATDKQTNLAQSPELKRPSPIQRKSSQRRQLRSENKSSRSSVDSPTKVTEANQLKTPESVEAAQENCIEAVAIAASSPSSPRKRSGPRAHTEANESPVSHDSSHDTKKKKKHKVRPPAIVTTESLRNRSVPVAEDPNPSVLLTEQPKFEEPRPSSPPLDFKDDNLTADQQAVESLDEAQFPPDIDRLIRRPSVVLVSSKSKRGVDFSVTSSQSASDSSNSDITRDPRGIEYGFEESCVDTEEEAPVAVVDISPRLVPKMPKILIGGLTGAKNVSATARYMQLLGLGTITTAADEDDVFQQLNSPGSKDIDLLCFDIEDQLDIAVSKLQTLQSLVGYRVIIIGGDRNEQERTQLTASLCLQEGAIYFATLPVDFAQLRSEVLAFFENSPQPYILRQRKAQARGPASLRIASTSIGAANMFAIHDERTKAMSPTSYAKISRPKPTSALPLLPLGRASVDTGSVRRMPSLKSTDEVLAPEYTATPPVSPRALKSYKKSPRLSLALQKLMR